MTDITWLGHAAFLVEGTSTSILIDPFLSGNPSANELPEGVRPDVIAVTHGHQDHFGDCLELARRFDSTVVAVAELGAYCESQGLTKVVRLNIGGAADIDGVRLHCVPAVHSSSVGPNRDYAGAPCGFVIAIDDLTIYHAGDTDVFTDMSLIGRRFDIDLALLPIGGTFTMDPDAALMALELLRPAEVTAMHFDTFPPIRQDVGAFADAVAKQGLADYRPMDQGTRTTLSGGGRT